MADVTKAKYMIAQEAQYLADQLADDLATLNEIKARWDESGRYQAGAVMRRFRQHPVPDPDSLLYIALGGIQSRQDAVVAEVRQAIGAGDVLLSKLHDALKAVHR